MQQCFVDNLNQSLLTKHSNGNPVENRLIYGLSQIHAFRKNAEPESCSF